MYSFSKENYKKYISKYLNIIINLFVVLFVVLIYKIDNNFSAILELIFITIAFGVFIYKLTIKSICKNYDLNVFKNAIIFSKKITINNETQDTTFFVNYEILKISHFKENKTCFVIYGDIRKNTQVAFTDDMGKDKFISKVKIYKGISNIEQFKQELERMKRLNNV
ncbi:MAG: hypothetical protein Q4Q31_04230 [Bacillota bacterium]|nr:hypothetical protein [Bacillota bacterium]